MTELARQDDHSFRLATSKGTIISAKAVIIAAGALVPSGQTGRHWKTCPTMKASLFFTWSRNARILPVRRVVIAGGGDSAVDWALSLSEIAAHVMVVHRRPKFRAAPDSEAKLNALAAEGKIDLVVPYQLSALEGANGQLTGVVVEDLDSAQNVRWRLIFYCPSLALAMTLGPIADWHLELEKSHIKVDPGTCATSYPGIFAIGDIATYPHKLKLILCGFSEAAQAAHAARHFIHPDQNFHFEYSTTKGVA